MSLSDVKIINDLGKAGKLDAALHHLRKSLSGNHRNDVFLFSAAIRVCGDLRNWGQALRLLDEMEQTGIEPNLVCCNTAITACVKNKQAQTALNVVYKLMQRGVKLDNYTCSTALKAYGLLKDWQGALQFLQNMPTMLGVIPNAHCYSAAINACERGGQWRKAVELFNNMQHQGVLPTTVVCTSVVSACKAHGQWEAALGVMEQMKRIGVVPDAHTFSNAISACDKAGKWQEALRIFDEMATAGVEPTVVCYGAVLSACEKGKQWSPSMQILSQMPMKPDHIIYTTVLSTCNKSNRWAEAKQIFDRMVQDRIKIDKRSYDMIISVLNRANKYQEALDYMVKALHTGVEVDQKVQEDLVVLGTKDGDLPTSLELLERMENEGSTPQAKTYNIVGKVCESNGDRQHAMDMWRHAGNWRKALTLLADVEKDGDGEEAYFCNAALHACGKGGAWEEALAILEKMSQQDIQPNPSSLGLVAQACKDAGYGDRANLLFEQKREIEKNLTMRLVNSYQ